MSKARKAEIKAEMQRRGLEFRGGKWQARILSKDELWALRIPVVKEGDFDLEIGVS